MSVSLEEAEQFMARAAREESERVAARGVFRVAARERVDQAPRVDERPRVEAAFAVNERRRSAPRPRRSPARRREDAARSPPRAAVWGSARSSVGMWGGFIVRCGLVVSSCGAASSSRS
ncbi:MAG: hypothetical protein LC800_18210 [Acidobacteria bacterium]|nr:hypothetical protein [Acidobacteriota bacterium]